MKKIIVIIITLTCIYSLTRGQGINKQEKGFFNITEAGLFFGGNDRRIQIAPTTFVSTFNDVSVRSLRNITGVFLTNRISLGLGIGLDGIQVKNGPFYNTFVLFADSRYYFKNDYKSWFVYGDIGNAVAIDKGFEKGLMFNIGGGYKFMVSSHTAVNASLGYNEQKIITTPNDKQRIPTIALKIGLML